MAELKKVVVTIPFTGWHWDKLEAALQPAEVLHLNPDDTDTVLKELEDADAALLRADLNLDMLKAGKNLKWIHCNHAGLNNSCKPEVFERGIILTGGAGRSGPVLAEHTFFLILSLIYKIHEVSSQQKAHDWVGTMYVESRGMYSKTMGIIGLGYTGREVAKRAKAFGMHVIGYDRNAGMNQQNIENVDEMYYADQGDSVDELLKKSDIVVLAVRLSDDTYHMIDARAFDIMKDSALLINIARGPVVDQEALIEALKTGKIAGCGSDVFEREPLEKESGLWELPNMVITPHCTPEMPDLDAECLNIICENIEHYRKDEPMKNRLDVRDIYTK